MATAQHILFAGGDRWRIARHVAGAVQWHDVAADADSVDRKLRDIHYDGQPILIALASSRCLACTLPLDNLPRNDFKARLFRLETQLPVAIEQIVTDFGPVSQGEGRESVLAVSCDRAWLIGLVAALESRHVAVGPIIPATLLAAQTVAASIASTDSSYVLISEPIENSTTDAAESINLLQFHSNSPTRWQVVRPTLADVRLPIEWQAMRADPIRQIGALGIAQTLIESLSRECGMQTQTITGSASEIAALAGAEILLQRRKPLINLRRGPLAIADRWRLHRPAIDASLAAAVMLLMSLALAFGWRANQYARSGARDEAEMRTIFHQTFPSYPTPTNVKAVVESEHRKLIDSPIAGAANGSTLSLLHAVFSHLPSATDFSIQHVNFSPLGFELTGLLKNYEAADGLASSLRVGGMNVGQPEARRVNESRWSFTLRGSAPNAAAPVARRSIGGAS